MTNATSNAVQGQKKADHLRALLTRPGIVVAAGAFDGLSARIAEGAGFDVVWASGLSISASHGLPDAGVLSMADVLASARTMNLAVRAPVLADCDAGFGDVNNVIRTVRSFESSGIAGICIEDKALPKRNSHSDDPQPLSSIGEFTDKLRAAVDARDDPSFVLVARVEALVGGESVAQAMERAEAYVGAGADAILVNSRRSDTSEIEAFATRWCAPVPLITLPTAFPRASATTLEGFGFSMCIFANQLIRSAVTALRRTSETLASTKCAAEVEGEIAALEELFEVQSRGFQVSTKISNGKNA